MKSKIISTSNAKLTNLLNRRFAVSDKRGGFCMRIWWTKPKGKRDGHWTVRCGCCSEGPVTIYPAGENGLAEINGVIGHTEDWIQMIRSGHNKAKRKA